MWDEIKAPDIQPRRVHAGETTRPPEKNPFLKRQGKHTVRQSTDSAGKTRRLVRWISPMPDHRRRHSTPLEIHRPPAEPEQGERRHLLGKARPPGQ